MSSMKNLVVIAAAALLAVSGTSRAQTCTSDSDCPKGMTCQASGDTPVPAIACVSDAGECPPLPGQPVATCQLASCQSDADCGQDMVCRSSSFTSCSASGSAPVKCDPGATTCEPVPPPPPPKCEETTVSQCIFKWQLPCNADADCGAGFVCQPNVTTACSGVAGSTGTKTATGSAGSGVGGASGGVEVPLPTPPSLPRDAGTPTAPECKVETSFPGYCQAKATSCNVDSDCPSNWICVESVVRSGGGVVSSGGASGTGDEPVSMAGEPAVAKDAGAAPAPMPLPIDTDTSTSTVTTTKTCQPSHYGQPISIGGAEGQGGASGGSDTGSVRYAADAGAKGTVTNPAPSPAPPSAAGGPVADTQAAAATTGGGCAIGAGALSGGSGLVLALLAGLAILPRRRRRQ